MGDDATVSNGVIVLPTVEGANDAYSLFQNRTVPKCLKELVMRSVSRSIPRSSSARAQSVNVGQQSVSTVGDRTTAYQAVVAVSESGVTAKVALDVQLAQVDRALALFTFRDVDDALRQTLLQAVVGRMR